MHGVLGGVPGVAAATQKQRQQHATSGRVWQRWCASTAPWQQGCCGCCDGHHQSATALKQRGIDKHRAVTYLQDCTGWGSLTWRALPNTGVQCDVTLA